MTPAGEGPHPTLLMIHGGPFAAYSVHLFDEALALIAIAHVFADAVRQYDLVGVNAARIVTYALPVLECVAAVGMLFSESRLAAAWLALALLAGVTGAIVASLLRGNREIDCGCGGEGQRLSGWLVLRNFILVGVILIGASESSLRVMLWVDYVTTFATILSLVGLYTGANQILTNAPRLAELRNPS